MHACIAGPPTAPMPAASTIGSTLSASAVVCTDEVTVSMSAGDESVKSARMQVDFCLLLVRNAAGLFLKGVPQDRSSCGRLSSRLIAFCMVAECCR